ncbi:cytochrome c oxidase assembly protein [Nocardia cyriacigeorgica]|uniref:cytochrome c oxidase assembly protein n=1 Tax=Nocardia cyriacigeorgica TaxID=135487 RepID=UPI0026A12A96
MNIPQAPPSWSAYLAWDPQPWPVLPVAGLVLGLVYLAAVRRVRRCGRQWPWWRTLSFVSGCLVLTAVTGLAMEGYGYRLFSAWMFQHLTLSMLIPPLWVLGSPGILLLRATPHYGWGRGVLRIALAGLRSRLARILLHPAVTVPLFLFSYYGLYLTPLLDLLGDNSFGHIGLEVFFLATGILFIVPVLSIGPLPIRQTNLGRFFDIFVEMPLHVFIGVILMMATTPMVGLFASPPPSWDVDPMADQQTAGALAWSYGEPIALVIVLIFAARWYRDEQRDNAVAERYPAIDSDGTDELTAYNAYLRRLHGLPDRDGHGQQHDGLMDLRSGSAFASGDGRRGL